MGEVKTYNETDFIWFDGEPKGVTHALLYDAVGADHIPAVVGASIVEDKEPIGFLASKHIHATPHTYLDTGYTGWPIYRRGNALIVEVLTPAHISKDIGQQKNAWLFNYPPARDVAKMLIDVGVATFFVLTSSAFDDLIEEIQIDDITCVKGEAIGKEDTLASLQPMWGWLPAFMFSVEREGAEVMIIPAHGAQTKALEYDATHIREALGILKRKGFVTSGAIGRSKKIYEDASVEASKAAKQANEIIARTKTENKKNYGGMFQ